MKPSTGALACAVLAVAVLTGALTAPAAATTRSAPPLATAVEGGPSPVVATPDGLLRGVRTGGAESFLAVPYAAAPVGWRRWRPPQPVSAWPGVRDATRHGPSCPQLPTPNGDLSLAEDCLLVNVHRPAGTQPTDRLPVLVFLHGGGLLTGSANQFDGSAIATSARAVVVTVNYRLGVFGFLALPGLTAEAGESGNYGVMDQQAALRWVRRAIGGFGGDPAAVTLAGESAGGFSACTHLAAPGSAGTYRAVVIQSGGCSSRTQAEAEAAGRSVARSTWCPDGPGQLACMRSRGASWLLAASGLSLPGPVRGTATLPIDPLTAVRTGQVPPVPVLIGSNLDEARSFTVVLRGWTRQQYEGLVRFLAGALAPQILAAYPWPEIADEWTAPALVSALLTDAGPVYGVGGCSTLALARDLARHRPTYLYEFAHRDGPGLAPVPGFGAGAAHAAELPYLWPRFDLGTPVASRFTAAEQQLSEDLLGWWGGFIRTGQPGTSAGGLTWPRFDTGGGLVRLLPGGLSTVVGEQQFAAQHHCGLWQQLAWPVGELVRLIEQFVGISRTTT